MEGIGQDLEAALKSDAAFLERVKDLDFAKTVYATFCNREWINGSGDRWSCSWRYAGGLVAEARDEGEDYLDFYLDDLAGDGRLPSNAAALDGEFLAILKRLGWSEITPEQEADAAIAADALLRKAEALPATEPPGWFSRFLEGKGLLDDGSILSRVRLAASRGQIPDQKAYWKLVESAFLSPEAKVIFEERSRSAAG